jgi:hypothetical protein
MSCVYNMCISLCVSVYSSVATQRTSRHHWSWSVFVWVLVPFCDLLASPPNSFACLSSIRPLVIEFPNRFRSAGKRSWRDLHQFVFLYNVTLPWIDDWISGHIVNYIHSRDITVVRHHSRTGWACGEPQCSHMHTRSLTSYDPHIYPLPPPPLVLCGTVVAGPTSTNPKLNVTWKSGLEGCRITE